jgi:hypothetical protein
MHIRFRPLALALAFTIPALSSKASAQYEFFPDAHEVFSPLRADPRELQYALRLILPVSRKLIGEAAMGDYIGLVRWTIGSTQLQVNGGGGVFGRFNISGVADDMESVDFFANVPLDWRSGRWSGRFMMFHTSSHLGDDFVKRERVTSEKHSWDCLRWLVAFSPSKKLRLYGGYSYAFRRLPLGTKRNMLQGGAELYTRRYAKHFEYYWANDFQSWERSDWNPGFTSQAGLRVYKNETSTRGIAFFMEFQTGPQSQGQFFRQKETRWSLGTRFHFT